MINLDCTVKGINSHLGLLLEIGSCLVVAEKHYPPLILKCVI